MKTSYLFPIATIVLLVGTVMRIMHVRYGELIAWIGVLSILFLFIIVALKKTEVKKY